MNVRASLLALLAVVVIAAGCGASAASDTKLVDIGAGIRGPDGSHAVVYAQGLEHASAFAFDRSNRLWVATAAYTDGGSDGVYVVTEAGATPVEVVKKLHTPLGLLWYRDELYVASKGRVDAYSGLAGMTFAKRRTVVTLPDGVGEVNNIALAPDGRLYMGISAPCDHCTPSSKWSGTVVSFRTDGTDLRIYASGIRAPVGLAFFPGTSDLLVTMNQRDDLGAQTPGDWLAVVPEGSAWGFPDCYGQGGNTCSGQPQPTAVLDQHAAVSGIAVAGTTAWVAEWATGKVLQITLTRDGSGYTGTVAPFVTGIKNPVAVAHAPDGSLLAGDWTTGTIVRITE